MKKLWILFLAAGFMLACNNDKNAGGKDKTATDKRETDDYRKTTTGDEKKLPENDNTTPENDGKTTGTDKEHDGWGDKNSGGADWTESDKSRFMKDCEGSATKKVGAARANEYCDCMLQKVKKLYSSYAEANVGLIEPRMKDKVDAMVNDCNNQ